MSQGNPFRHNKRMLRVQRLLRHMQPSAQPVTYRRNRMVFLSDGLQFFRSLLVAIRTARSFILLEYYMIRNDSTGTAFAAELADAVRRGVSVFLIYDYIGSVETPSSYFKTMMQQGIKVIPFNVPSFRRGIRWFDRRDHRKMTIIDGNLAFLGGFNIGNEYACVTAKPDRFRDLGFSLAGSAVKELISIFCETWQMERGESLLLPPLVDDQRSDRFHGKANVIIVSGGPHHRSSYIRAAFLVSIASASEELLIVNPYFVPGPRIIRSLLRAARRGVRVRLLLPARSDVRLMLLVGRSSYGALLKGGVEIYEMEQEILHAKVMLVDGERTVIGSANLDQRSFHRNFEINGVIDNSSFNRQIHRVLEQDLKGCRRITFEDHDGRGKMTRVLEKMVNLFSWFL